MSGLTAVSLFAGVGGIDLALERAGVRVVAAVEIDPACRGVLARHFPATTLFKDVTEVTGDQLRAAGFVPERGILAAGWPCQGNSAAGRRQGMADPRSGLWVHVARLLAELRPAWFLGENVPGLYSVNGGRDIAVVRKDLAQCGYWWAERILDAQHFGVPQRRRRVFFAGCPGDPRGPVEVLFEPEGGGGHPAPRGETGAGAAGRAPSGAGISRAVGALGTTGPGGGWRLEPDEAAAGQLVAATAYTVHAAESTAKERHAFEANVIRCLDTTGGFASSQGGTVVAATLQGGGRRGHRIDAEGAAGGHLIAAEVAYALTSHHNRDSDSGQTYVTHTLTGEGFDASEDGTGRSTPIVPIGVPLMEVAAPLTRGSAASEGVNPPGRRLEDDTNLVALSQAQTGVRRLTPRECERLQGLPAITKVLRIEAWHCSGHPKSLAPAGGRNHKSQKSASNAAALGSCNTAQPAGSHSQCSRPGHVLPVAASVHFDCEVNAAEIHSPDGRRWSVTGAEPREMSLLAALSGVSARLFALTPHEQEQAISTGRAASLPNPGPSTPRPSGATCVHVCGLGINGSAGGAHECGLAESSHFTSTTSRAGHSTQNSGLTWATLCSSVLAAIGSFIPLPTLGATSYAVELTASAGWTRWLADGTEQSDSARYRQCGNSVAVPVLEWITRRIAAVDAAREAEDAA